MDPGLEHSAAVTARSGGEDLGENLADTAPSSTGIGDEELEPGQTIELGADAARYEVLRLLGRGGTAEVYLARKVGPGDFVREVALKCMTPGLEFHEPARKAFVYEARLACRLHHPNIAGAFDLAQIGDRYCLVLEYVDGVTSRAAIKAAARTHRRLSEGLCCYVGASIASALHHAHALADPEGQPLGLVHRDVSAKNVIIARSGVVKLLDFGIAIARIQGRDRTRTGTIKGTFSYLSPEQVFGDPLDGRSDLFSLGILLVELLTGRRVFDAESEAGTIGRISACRPAVVKAATSGLPRTLARICERALSLRPTDRFQDGAEFASALRHHLGRRGIEYGPSDCAAELRELGLLGDQTIAASPDTADSEVGTPTSDELLPEAADDGGEETIAPRPRSVWPARAIALGLVAATVLLPPSSEPKGVSDRVVANASPSPSQPAPAAPPAEAAPAPRPPAEPTPQPVPEPTATRLEGPVVRPKRRVEGSRATLPAGQGPARPDRRERPVRKITAGFADRPSAETAGATLARGTLVAAKLTRPVYGASPGQAGAVVVEDVLIDGALIVPKGSTIVCSSRRSVDGRVPMACDTIRSGAGQLSFQGVVVGDGHHLGLRALDDEVAAGTSFVIYVNASASTP